jgi:hypothetical protein
MILPPDHILRALSDRDAPDYEAARVIGPARSPGEAIREGRYLAGTGIPLSEVR